MTRDKAAAKVNEAFSAAKVGEKIRDPSCKEFAVDLGAHTASHKFKYGTNALEQRKHEVAEFRAKLVGELCEGDTLLKAKPVEDDEGEPRESTPIATPPAAKA